MSGAAVVLLSGGMDSTVLLWKTAEEAGAGELHAISFDYGQRHGRELDCARWQAAKAGVGTHRIIDVSFLAELVKEGTTLVRGGGDVPDLASLSDAELAQPPTYVPNRNMMLLSIAAAYAESQGVARVLYGAQAHDEYGYWDCTEEFLTRLNAALALNRKTPVVIEAPFMREKKSELVRLGVGLGVDFAHTWSCYRGRERACGTCPTCVERLKAFREAGVADPLE